MIAYSPPKNGKKMHGSKSIMVSAGIPTSKLTSLQKERSCTMQYLVLALGVLGVFGCLFDPLGRLTACSCGVFACLHGCVSQAELMRPYHSSHAPGNGGFGRFHRARLLWCRKELLGETCRGEKIVER